MNINLANLILLLPVATTLAVILAVTGGQILRPKLDAVRTFVHIVIWVLIALSLFGLLGRLIPLGGVLTICFVMLVIGLLTTERSIARSMILLTLLAHHGNQRRLAGVARYLSLEGIGYWKRLGARFESAFASTGDWMLATKQARIARDEYDYMALGTLEQTGNRTASRQQIMRAIELRQQGSIWRGRVVAASISLIPLMALGIFHSTGMTLRGQNLFAAMMEEFNIPITPEFDRWMAISQLQLHVFVPLLVWAGLLMAYLIKSIPALTGWPPISWLFRRYHRALCLAGLSEVVKVQPELGQACRSVAQSMLVIGWARRLNTAASRIEAGEEFSLALKKSGLVKHQESTALTLCRDSESLAWALHEIGQAVEQRTQNRTNVMVQFLVVALILVSAWLTSLIAISVVSSLATFILHTDQLPP